MSLFQALQLADSLNGAAKQVYTADIWDSLLTEIMLLLDMAHIFEDSPHDIHRRGQITGCMEDRLGPSPC